MCCLLAGPGLPIWQIVSHKPEGPPCRSAEEKQPYHSSQCQWPRGGRAGQVPVLHADTDDATALLNEKVHCLQAGRAVCGSTDQVRARHATEVPGLRNLSLRPTLEGLQLHLHYNDLHTRDFALTNHRVRQNVYLWRHVLSSHDEVPLILPVLVVQHHYELSRIEVIQGLWDAVEALSRLIPIPAGALLSCECFAQDFSIDFCC